VEGKLAAEVASLDNSTPTVGESDLLTVCISVTSVIFGLVDMFVYHCRYRATIVFPAVQFAKVVHNTFSTATITVRTS
jgi:hypothetical protein